MAKLPIDIVVTWPKKTPLSVYLRNLREAARVGADINYRVANRPYWSFGALRERPARCYRVHDGAVRGYTEIKFVAWREAGEVANVTEGGTWPPGWYVVCSPVWHRLVLERPIYMRGFQGWHWFDVEAAI